MLILWHLHCIFILGKCYFYFKKVSETIQVKKIASVEQILFEMIYSWISQAFRCDF